MISKIITAFLISMMITAAHGCGSAVVEEESTQNSRLFAASCQSCHTLPKPTDKSDEEWPPLVRKYGEQAKLTGEQIDRITIYLLANN
ncbi:MAG: cytochrome c [candidate division Zixibacteria bacterium]|nr:cytochrome c [candidate division Zixibacteria bacterium]